LGIFIGLNTTQAGPTDNQFNVFIDTDAGGTGLADYSLAGIANTKKTTFSSPGFIPNFVLLGTGIENWSANAAWDLYEFTDDTGTTSAVTTGVNTAVANKTVFDGSWSYPIPVNYEGFIPWNALYSGGIPADAEIRLFAAMIGGEPGDVIPNQYLDKDPTNVAYSNYVAVQVADADGDPQIIPYVIGWDGAGSEEVNEVEGGGVTLGLDMKFTYMMWWNVNGTSKHDYMNSSEWPMLYYTYYNSTAMANDSEVSVQMFHQAGYYGGLGDGSDVYHYIIPLDVSDGYSVDDIFYWYILAGDQNSSSVTHYNNTVVPMPPIDIGFVGNIDPAGGFKNPDTPFDITVQIEQLWNGTDKVQIDVLTEVTLNYTLNDTGVWNTQAMTYDSVQGENAQYKTTIGGFADGSNVTFYINVTNNNTVITTQILVLILIPPPESTIFYMTDPQGDEWGTYPWNAAFGGKTEGIFDILEFNVSANIYQTTFRFRLADTYDPGWGAGNFSHQLFVVLVDKDPGGTTDGVLRSYANTVGEWDVAFYADGWIQRYFTPSTIQDPQTSAHAMTSGYDFVNGEHWMYFTVPETLFGELADSTWQYYVMIGSGDFNDFRNHKAANEEWAFGGGDDSDVDPNYNDILVPEGGDSAAVQNFISSSYDVASGTRVSLLAVGPGLTYVDDMTDPLVDITSPADGANYSWTTGDSYTIDVTYAASDPDEGTFNGLESVKLFINAVLVPDATDTSGTVTLAVGANTIRVVAEDISGNTALAEITVTLTDDREVEPPPAPVIPGYEIGILVIAILGTAFLLSKRHRRK
jgi:hypothetical protein